MKKENNMRVKMFRVVGDLAPFVEVDYMDKDAQEHTGLLLLDSGSNINILSNDMSDSLGMLCKLEDETSILSISQEVLNAKNVRFSFALGGKQFTDTFCLSNQCLPIKMEGMDVIGILGIPFFIQHQLVIDYHDFTLHTSEISPNNLSTSDCDFFFPMEIGLQFYDLPVLSIKQNGKELVTLVDSGATDNMIAEKTLNDNGFNYKRTRGKDTMNGVTGQIDVNKALVGFNMLSLLGDDIVEISRYEPFAVLPCNVFTPKNDESDTNGEQLPPIELLIGSPFLAKEGWILDFGAKIIYKRKSSDHLKEAV